MENIIAIVLILASLFVVNATVQFSAKCLVNEQNIQCPHCGKMIILNPPKKQVLGERQ